MSYEVLARKWRPQVFADVVGQDHVIQTLHHAIENNRLAHAYLFVGPRGTGKTTTARILAKALNCQTRNAIEPCNTCDSCKEIVNGNSLDVMEIDGASNRGIGDIQTLRDNVRYAPVRGPFKIYIIDEVHMLTREAFNAILKTLEEPPPHVKFFFATTEPQKVLTTILSRCQRFDLRRISIADIIAQLKKIATTEGIQITDNALLAIARGAEGGLRDAESALDQLIAFCGKTIKEADVLSVFGLISRMQLDKLSDAIIDGNIPAIIKTVSEIDQNGKDMQRVILELLNQFRNLLIVLHSGANAGEFDLPETQVDTLRKQAEKSSDGRLLRIVDLLIDADSRMRYALSKRTLLEASLIRASRAATVATIDELMQQIATLKGSSAVAPAPTVVAQQPPGKKREKPLNDDPLADLKKVWAELIKQTTQNVPLVQRYLLDTDPLSLSNTHVTIGVDPEFDRERDSSKALNTHLFVRKALSIFFEHPIPEDFDIQIVHTQLIPVSKQIKNSSDKQIYYDNPSVRNVLETFNGDIIDIRK